MTETQTIGLAPPGPSERRARGLRWPLAPSATVVVLASALIFIIVATFVFLCFQGYGATVDAAKAKAQTATDLVADEIDFLLDGALSALRLISVEVPDPAIMSAEQMSALTGALRSMPAQSNLALYDASGHVLAVAPGGEADISQSAAFKALSAGADFMVLPQGQDPGTGAPIIALAYRLGTAADFKGIAVLSVPGSILGTIWATQNLGKDSTVNVHLDNGQTVGRYPPLDTPSDAAGSPNWTTISNAETGTYITTSPIDQVMRAVGFRHIHDLGIVVFATVSLDAALAGLWNAIIIVSWLIAPIALALLVGSLITAGLLRRSARTQASLAAALANNEVLFREIHHRVKNNLQSVASLLQMQPIPREVKADMSQRIAAMSAVHEHIYRSNNFASVEVKDYLQTLIANIRAGSPDVTVIENIEDVSVDKDAATPLGLILNEVVSNAFKHAFKDGRKGVVTVSLTQRSEHELCLTVDDNGVGFDPEIPAKGIGRRLIAALTQQLGGQSGFSASSSGGSRFTLTFPPGPRS